MGGMGGGWLKVGGIRGGGGGWLTVGDIRIKGDSKWRGDCNTFR